MTCTLRPLPAICERFVKAFRRGDLPACEKCPYDTTNAKPVPEQAKKPDWWDAIREANDWRKPRLGNDEGACY